MNNPFVYLFKAEQTKPNEKRHRANPGGTFYVLGGVIGDRVRLWHYVDEKWNGATAAAMYEGPIQETLARYRPSKTTWRIVEDNDPVGFKSGKAEAMKKGLGMVAVEWPKYSPDLMPLDFSLWTTIEQRARAAVGKKRVSVREYKRVLRETALGMSAVEVRSVMASMRKRIQLCWEHGGGNIPRD